MNYYEEAISHENMIPHYFESLLNNSRQQGASDIHIEANSLGYKIRFRIDGLLREKEKIKVTMAKRLINHIKHLANLDITETRRPQDGRLEITIQQQRMNLRVSICPTYHHEKLVIRILKTQHEALKMDAIGLQDKQYQLFKQHLKLNEGLILICGPTGSGKSITLYSAIDYLNAPEINLMSIEDPIEITIDNINQVALNPKIGLNFANILRSSLRQDPDVIMLGEIRDQETAEITLKAAQTGHLVLSSLHCNRAIDAFLRLKHLGVETYDIAHSIKLIIAQRLVRRLCVHCQGKSCEQCFQGFRGRTGIFECLVVNESIRHKLMRHEKIDEQDLESMCTLIQSGEKLVAQGTTTEKELRRVC